MTTDQTTTAGTICDHPDHTACTHPEGATLHLGGTAWAHPDAAPHLRPITSVTTYPGNPRRGDQDQITASIRDLGFYGTLQNQTTTGHILVGNHRLRGLLALDAVLAPITDLTVSDSIAAALVARDNRTSDAAHNDAADLLALLKQLEDEELLALAGYDDHTELEMLARQAEAEYAFTVDHSTANDEFLAITGLGSNDRVEMRTFRMLTVWFEDQAAVDLFCEKLAVKLDDDQKRLSYPKSFRRKDVPEHHDD